jgi:hypothetical protein
MVGFIGLAAVHQLHCVLFPAHHVNAKVAGQA